MILLPRILDIIKRNTFISTIENRRMALAPKANAAPPPAASAPFKRGKENPFINNTYKSHGIHLRIRKIPCFFTAIIAQKINKSTPF